MLPNTPRFAAIGCSAEVLNQRSPLGDRKTVRLVDENADADPLQQLERAVEDDEHREADSAHLRGGTLDTPQEQIDRRGEHGNEQQHPHVDDHPPGHLVVQILVDLVALAARMEEQQDRPRKRHTDHEHQFLPTEGSTLHRSRP